MEKSRNGRPAAFPQDAGISAHCSFVEASSGTYNLPGPSQLHSTNHVLPRNAIVTEPKQQAPSDSDRYDTIESSQNLQNIKNMEPSAKTAFPMVSIPVDKSTNAASITYQSAMNSVPLATHLDGPLYIAFPDSDKDTHENVVPMYTSQVGKQIDQATSSGFLKREELTTYRKHHLQNNLHGPHGVNINHITAATPTTVYHDLDHNPRYPAAEHSCHYSCHGQSDLLFRCGACGEVQSSICYLHLHMQGHTSGGLSYHYDHLLRTAFPKFGSICQGTQTFESEAKIGANSGSIREYTLFDMAENTVRTNDMHSRGSNIITANTASSNDLHTNGSNTNKLSDFPSNDLKKDDSHNSRSFANRKMLVHSFDRENVQEDGENSVPVEEMNEVVNDSDDIVSNGENVNDALEITANVNDKHSIKQEKEAETNVSKCKKVITRRVKRKRKRKQDKLISGVKSKTKRKSVKVKKETESGNDFPIKKSPTSDAKSSFSCGICLEQYSSEEGLACHVQTEHATKTEIKTILECKWCLKTFKTHKIRYDHEKGCEKNDNLKCYICETVSSSKSELLKHLLVHRNREDLTCKICSKSLVNEISMRAHIRRHVQPRTIQCEQCGKAFYYKHLLKKHMVYCNDERPVECSDCDLRFKTKEAQKHHSSVHKDDKPFVCHICGYAGKKYMYLKRHIRSHTGERPYPCKVCAMRFSSLNGLNRHNKVHTNTKTCVCSYCGKSFTNNWNLKTHLRQHTGEHPYTCKHCGQGFKQNVLLKLHVKSHHQPCV